MVNTTLTKERMGTKGCDSKAAEIIGCQAKLILNPILHNYPDYVVPNTSTTGVDKLLLKVNN